MANDLTAMALLIGAAWLLLALLLPRHAVYLLLLWLPIQGWIQLNLLDDSSATVLLYEFQVVGLYIVFTVQAIRFPEQFGPPRILWFAIPFAIWALLLVPRSLAMNGWFVTLVGLRAFLLPLPLVWIGYRAFQSRRQLENVAWLLMLQLPVIAAVTASQFLNLLTGTGNISEIPVGFMQAGVIRPPGTFSAPGQLGVYLLLSISLAMGLLGLNVHVWKRAGFVIGLAGATAALIVNTQRTTLVLLAVTLPIIVLLARKLRALKWAIVALCVVLAGGAIGSQVAGEVFAERVESISFDVRNTLIDAPAAQVAEALRTPVSGVGLGIASPGTSRLLVPTGMRNDKPIGTINPSESFVAALVLESGVPGLVLFLLFGATLTRAGVRAVRECRNTDMGLLAAAIVGFELGIWLQSWSYSPLNYPPGRVLFWFWAGVLLSLPKLAGQSAVRQWVPARIAATPVRRLARPPLPVRPPLPSTARRSRV